jgi:SAM-dependent methyltransferase
MGSSSSDFEQNRTVWDEWSPEYQATKDVQGGFWGVWSVPEDDLQILGEVRGKDVLELGCGAAQWSIELAQEGANVVGLDNSERQLEHARQLMGVAGVEFPLVHSPAEQLPFEDETFDVVFCDWGATNFADPYLVVPEVARVLRPAGLFAFSGATPISWLALDDASDTWTDRLHRDYFGMRRWATPDGTVEFVLGYGDAIRLFGANGLAVEDLIEIRPAPDAHSTFRDEGAREWARRWPMEQIWKVRKR